MKYLKYIIKKNRGLICIYLLLGIAAAFLSNFNANYFQILIDKFSQNSMTLRTIAIYAVSLISLCVINYIDNYPNQKLSHGIYLDFKLLALKKISVIDYQAYNLIGTGELTQRIENGSSAGENILVDFAFRIIRELMPSILFSMIFIWKISQGVMLTMLGGYVIVFIVTNLLLKALYKIKEKILTHEEAMNHFLIRGFTEMVTFRVNRRFNNECNKANKSKKEIVSSKIKMTLIHEAFFAVFALLVIIIKIAIIFYGWKSKSLSVGEIIAIIALIDNAYTPIAIFNVLYIQFKLDRTAYDRYIKFLNLPEDEKLISGDSIKNIEGNISINNLSFKYGDKQIFQKFDLNIRKATKIAFVGESGSGKSTLIKLLIGLLKPNDGNILIDNYDLNTLNLNDYYKNIIYISQESPIFEGTIRENIIFDKEISDEEIILALEKVNLTEFYKKQENGLDTKLGERGINISGGERQRLALSRLWFSDADIVILDEATSAMDNITEKIVIERIMDKLKHKTVIMISHRLNIVRDFDEIVLLQNGAVQAKDNFKSLLENNTYFQKLYNTQT